MEYHEREIDLSYLILPPHYVGRWKLYIEVKYKNDEGKEFQDCHMIREEIEMI